MALQESPLAEGVHQLVDLPPRGADQLSEQIPRNHGQRRARQVVLVEVRQQQKDARESSFGSVEELPEQIRLDLDISGQEVRPKPISKNRLVVQSSPHLRR